MVRWRVRGFVGRLRVSFDIDDFVAESLPEDNCIHRQSDLREIVRDVLILAANWIRDAEGDGVANDFLRDFGVDTRDLDVE